MKKILSYFVAFLVVVAVQSVLAQSAEELFHKGVQLEEVKGELEKAIDVYKTLVSKHAANKPVAAKALLRVGKCYEKLGMTEAKRAYERILREFGDQTSAVKEARTRLAMLTKTQEGPEKPAMTTRQVWAGRGVDILGSISSDGRYLSFTDWDTGDLAIRDLATGQNRRLTQKGSWWSSEFAERSIISPDGKYIVYTWFNNKNKYDVRIIGFDGQGSRVLFQRSDVNYIWPTEWSRHGKDILAILYEKDGAGEIVLLSSTTGDVRTIKRFTDPQLPHSASISPDVQWVVYDSPQSGTQQARDIFIIAVGGGREQKLIEHDANDFYAAWTPDGKHILFASDRSGKNDAWMLRVQGGKAQALPELVKSDFGDITPLGFTQSGSFYYGLNPGRNDVFVATLDSSTGKVLSAPTPIARRFVGSNTAPEWSPDGKHLAYLSQRRPYSVDKGSRTIVIRSMKTGDERELQPKVSVGFRLRWSPDGRWFLALGEQLEQNFGGLCRIDIETGEATTLIKSSWDVYVLDAWWFPDGKRILYTLMDADRAAGTLIIVRDLNTGAERELGRYRMRSRALSPDGSSLAFWQSDSSTKSIALFLLPTADGKLREILRLKEEQYGGIGWSPDARYLIFGRQPVAERKVELWRIPATGGTPEKLDLAMEGLRTVSVRPDGKQIAFDVFHYKPEIWMMENFLPIERTKR